MDPVSMDIDPIDDGPKEMPKHNLPVVASGTDVPFSAASTALIPTNISKEEEARQAIEMLRGDDVAGRVAAANRLEAVATVLGPERTRTELVPFLKDAIDDEDEVLLAMAKSLGKLVDHVGGNEYLHHLLPPLELLLMVEEVSVREAASSSTLAIAERFPDDFMQDQYADLLLRLAEREWFTARMSSCRLISSAYKRMTRSQQNSFIELYCKLCRDDTPMVRRIAAKYLGVMAKNVFDVIGREAVSEDGPVTKFFVPLYHELASTEQGDSVRLQTTENCVRFGEIMSSICEGGNVSLTDTEMGHVHRLLPLVIATIDDRSWRVRWTAAAKFADVVKAYHVIPKVMDALIPAYEKLLQDPEAEVRTAATFNLSSVANCKVLVPPSSPPTRTPTESIEVEYQGQRVTVAERLVKRITSLTEDDSEHVRAALAMVATELAPMLGKDATITHLVPPVLLLLRDAASDVRLNLIASLGALNEVIGIDLLSQSLLPAILDLAQDGKWRIRLAIIQHMPLLGKQLGQDFFTSRLSNLCVAWLGDDIATVRTAAAKNLRDLTKLFGSQWACHHLKPAIQEISRHPSYLRRLTSVQACSQMAQEMEAGVATTEMLPLLLKMAMDPVANIRFNVARELVHVAPICGVHVYETQIVRVLSMLEDDADRDVRFHAENSIKSLEEFFAQSE